MITMIRTTIIAVVLLSVAPTVRADNDLAGCLEHGEHDAVTFLLVDRSDKLEDTRNLRQSLEILGKSMQPGERLIVGVSTDSVSTTRILADIVKPSGSMWESKLKTRAAEAKFKKCFESVRTELEKQQESYKSSAIIETLSFASKGLRSDHSSKKRLIVYSDMVQNSTALSFYKGDLNVPAALEKISKASMLWDFKGVSVHVAGAGGTHDQKALAIEQFWKGYFEKCQGTLEYYGPTLLLQ